MKKTFLTLLCVLPLILIPVTAARAAGIFASADAGTMGLGVNLGYQLNNMFKFRLNGNMMAGGGIFRVVGNWAADRFAKHNGSTVADYTLSTHQYSLGLLADVHPFAGRFRVTGGAYYLKHDLSAQIFPRAGRSIPIGDRDYSGIQRLDVGIEWQKFAPYLGLGWGTEEGLHSAINFSTSLGLVFSKPDVRMEAHGGSVLQTDIDKEKADMDRSLNWFRLYPVISLGMSYRF